MWILNLAMSVITKPKGTNVPIYFKIISCYLLLVRIIKGLMIIIETSQST